MNKYKRIESLDILRGLALVFVILFHSSIYNFANINKLDFSNPPLIIVLISFMALWGGIFIIYSTIVNTYMLGARIKENQGPKIFSHLLITAGLLIMAHYILNVLLGRWNVDFVNNQPDMTFIAATLRTGTLSFPHISKFFDGSSLSTIAFNLIFFTLLFRYLFKNNGINKTKRNYWILSIIGSFVMIISFVRVSLFPLLTQAINSHNYLMSIIYSFILNNPYPLLPYLAYGSFGALIGLFILFNRKDLMKKVILPLGSLFLIYGLYGMTKFDKTISTPDYFWYFKTNFELGLFLLLIPATYLFLEGKYTITNKLTFLKCFSRVSLTVYMSETFVSEIVRILVTPIIPQWNQTINASLLFGGFNVLIWIIILYFWKKINFKYSLEYYWVILLRKVNKQSTKMEPLTNPN